jgi:LmbE family N-acetylglucosaminyl deacetylase
MEVEKKLKVAVVVAHPDDETLWCGGTILNHPEWDCVIVCLCRASDPDRSPKFHNVLNILGAGGVMGDLDDGPDQFPLPVELVEKAIMQLIPETRYDLIISHDLVGEYTRHLRHEEISKAIILLWNKGEIFADELWTFAYEDGNKQYLPQPIKENTSVNLLSKEIWELKYHIITDEYGYDATSWEASTTPKEESFHQYKTASEALKRLLIQEVNESSATL